MKPKLAESSSDTIRLEVRQRYGATARGESSSADDCCTSTSSDALGYSAEDSTFAPEAANLGLGCGNPLAIASLIRGQTVLDQGSGAGFDCFLAARAVGPTGKVIGVDMTPEMLTNRFNKELHLNMEQHNQILAILTASHQKMEARRQEIRQGRAKAAR